MGENQSTAEHASSPQGDVDPDGRLQFEELRQFRAAMDASPDCVLISDPLTLSILYVNDTVCRLTGFSRQEILQLRPHDLTGQQPDEWSQTSSEAMAAGGEGLTMPPHIGVSKDGARKGWWEPHHRAIKLDGRWLIVTSSREVSRRVLAEESALRAKRLYATLSATNETIMRCRSRGELFQQVCEVAVSVGGFASVSIMLIQAGTTTLRCAGVAGAGQQRLRDSRIVADPALAEGRSLAAIALTSADPAVSNDFLNDPRTRLWHDLANQISLKSAAAIPIIRENGPVGVLCLCDAEKRAFDDEVVGLLVRMTANLAFALQNFDREAERDRAEARIRYLATHDDLTGLPKRSLFRELLTAALRSAERYQRNLAVMFMDLDHFKRVNDTLGHAAGDALLQALAERLSTVLRESDVLARHGGDEFMILLHEVAGQAGAATVAQKLLDAARESMTVEGRRCEVTASIGISLFPAHGTDEETLMRNADTAMYASKEQGKDTFAFYGR